MKFPTPTHNKDWVKIDGPVPQAPVLEKINVSEIPTFQEYTLAFSVKKLDFWFTQKGYKTEIKEAPSGNLMLTVKGVDWMMYAHRGDTDPVNGLLEPWDEETMIFVNTVY
jgi:hypothetical protein